MLRLVAASVASFLLTTTSGTTWKPDADAPDQVAAFDAYWRKFQEDGNTSEELKNITWTTDNGPESLRRDCKHIQDSLTQNIGRVHLDPSIKQAIMDVQIVYTFLCNDWPDPAAEGEPKNIRYFNFNSIVGSRIAVDQDKLNDTYAAADYPGTEWNYTTDEVPEWVKALQTARFTPSGGSETTLTVGQVNAFMKDMEQIIADFVASGKKVKGFEGSLLKACTHADDSCHKELLEKLHDDKDRAINKDLTSKDVKWWRPEGVKKRRSEEHYDDQFTTWWGVVSDSGKKNKVMQNVSFESTTQNLDVIGFCLNLKKHNFVDTLDQVKAYKPPDSDHSDYANKLRTAIQLKTDEVAEQWGEVPICSAGPVKNYLNALMDGYGHSGEWEWAYTHLLKHDHWSTKPSDWNTDDLTHHGDKLLHRHSWQFWPGTIPAWEINQQRQLKDAKWTALPDEAINGGNMMYPMLGSADGAPKNTAISVKELMHKVDEPNKGVDTTYWVFEGRNQSYETRRSVLPPRRAEFRVLLELAGKALKEAVTQVDSYASHAKVPSDGVFNHLRNAKDRWATDLLQTGWPPGTVAFFPTVANEAVMNTWGDAASWKDDLGSAHMGPAEEAQRTTAALVHESCHGQRKMLTDTSFDTGYPFVVSAYQTLLQNTQGKEVLTKSQADAQHSLKLAQHALSYAQNFVTNNPACAASKILEETASVVHSEDLPHPQVWSLFETLTEVEKPTGDDNSAWVSMQMKSIKQEYPATDQDPPSDQDLVPAWLKSYVNKEKGVPQGLLPEGEDQLPNVVQLAYFLGDAKNAIDFMGAQVSPEGQPVVTVSQVPDTYFDEFNKQVDALKVAIAQFATDDRISDVPSTNPHAHIAADTGELTSVAGDLPDLTNAQGAADKIKTKVAALSQELFLTPTTTYYVKAKAAPKSGDVDDYSLELQIDTPFTADVWTNTHQEAIRSALVAQFGSDAVGETHTLGGSTEDNLQIWRDAPALRASFLQQPRILTAAAGTAGTIKVLLYTPLGKVDGIKTKPNPDTNTNNCGTCCVVAIIAGSAAVLCLLIGLIVCMCGGKKEEEDEDEASSGDDEL